MIILLRSIFEFDAVPTVFGPRIRTQGEHR